MIEDVYEPLTRYRDEFKDKFAALAKSKFKALVNESRIDVEANRKQAGVVRVLESSLSSARRNRTFFGILMTVGYICTAIGFGYAVMTYGTVPTSNSLLASLGGAVSLAFAVWMTKSFRYTGGIIRDLESKVSAARDIAWKQMAPLNGLYTWDITTDLIQQTVPRLQFDPYFTSRRLADLKRIYGWNDEFNEGRSVLFAQSGVINGNPFLIGEYLEMEWGVKTYTGSLTIHWREEVEDEDGKTHYETRTETLTASVDKPYPCYSREKVLIYGNDAAPSLSFSRQPSSLSGAEDGLVTSMRKKWRLSRLKALARDLENSDFTLMANHEFETLFHCRDRDNEVEFRLLYTALAQNQTLALLKDKEVGYGDDFAFIKQRKINMIFAEHLDEGTIDTAPERFRHWDFDTAAANFMAFNERYFKDVYFALAPILAIPLYQQTRNHEDIWDGVTDTDSSSFWEHEATANYFGEDKFSHPDCITHSILKTREVSRENGVSNIEVTAYGFRGEDRRDYESVLGGDGEFHDVPIDWVEYLPVSNSTEIEVTEMQTPADDFAQKFESAANSVRRRSVYSFIR